MFLLNAFMASELLAKKGRFLPFSLYANHLFIFVMLQQVEETQGLPRP